MIEANLATACERTLVAAARAQRAGTRQQLRAAARHFVRRHRRDAGYLRWVLRSVGASSALALALLGLGAEPAHAKATLFTELTGAANPLDGQNVQGLFSTPAFGDLDGDGDLDLVSGERSGTFAYFENTGSATSAAHVARSGAQNPLDGEDAGLFSTPALGDLDGDGDLDLVAGEKQGGFFYFENTGDATGAAFAAQTGSANPLDALSADYFSAPALGDLDGDGDLDLLAGDYDATLRYYENTGSATSPAFIERTGAANPFDGYDLEYYAAPAFGDLDFDGDLELVAGNLDGEFFYFENTGSATSPGFTARTAAASPLEVLDVGAFSAPALCDLDANGVLELVVGEAAGIFHTFENRTGNTVERGTPLIGVGWDFYDYARPTFGDLDADGDLDLVGGRYYTSAFLYFENTGSPSAPAFIERTGGANPLDGQSVYRDAIPALGDLDADGDLDLVSGDRSGAFFYFENTGSAASPAFVARTGAQNPIGGAVFFTSSATLGDLDGDGDLDLFSGTGGDSSFHYFENTGSPSAPAFIERTGAANPLDGVEISPYSLYSVGVLGDLDADADLDFVAAGYDTPLAYFENTGGAASPAFVRRDGASDPLDVPFVGARAASALADLDGDGDLDVFHGGFVYRENPILRPSWLARFHALPATADPLDGVDAGAIARPALGDLDRDGDRDLVVAEYDGGFLYFENTAGALSPSFAARTGAANPFDGEDVGLLPAAAQGDLDRDGDLDLVAGENLGAFFYFENTGDAESPAFAPRTGAANPLDGHDVGLQSTPALGDLDGDGDLDLVSGTLNGLFTYFENTGGATSPAFAARTGAANPLDAVDVGDRSVPALADLDLDGDLDLVAGNLEGSFSVFENTGSATAAAFAPRTGAQNPLDGEDVGGFSAPALGDLDGDGDPDLVAGEAFGALRTFYLPEPGQGLLLGAGLALLSWLERVRRRGRRE